MKLALDYDNTYTASVPFWRDFILLAQKAGNEVKIVTMRSKELDYETEFDFLKKHYGVETVFCDGFPKKDICAEQGYEVDIWIDDMPEGISRGTQYTLDQLTAWREAGRPA
jgi:hypothetical protein